MGDPMLTPIQTSAGELLQLIRSGRANTRADLQRITGLSRSTVGQRLDLLNRAGWLKHVAGSSTGGRPSQQIVFDPRHASVIAVDLETRYARAAVLDLAGTILAESTGPLDITEGPETVLDLLAGWVPDLITAAGVDAGHICGIGLSVPGPVEWETGQVIEPPIMPGWDRHPIRERLQRAYAEHVGASMEDGPIPVFVDNDANLMALAEHQANHRDCSAFVLVKVSTGIGAGVVVNGEVYRGIDGGAGDIGHIRLHDRSDVLCLCGSHGCLGAVASGRALAHHLTDLGVDAASASDVKRLLSEGHPDALRLAREAGRRAGEVLVTVVSLLNPGVLMIAGELSGAPFMTGVRELLYQRAFPRATANLQVVTSRLGDHAGVIGAAGMVVEILYSSHRADDRLNRLAV
ncbi:Sugar kinase of the NBD/HSP70 family, may contain an N-terminal HTH domain [Streptomyces sp. 1222.5]|uniref:ROK family transcriptional regulator n=1 Tax=unclassified Streptomyces TaxID=2593676 RepID=UPI000899DB74|nr:MULTISPECIES: ROK family protein [unclassified Streptomyces]PKW04961.1 putative NBD/HSP70 family sugar kinase [Streptomyces sp. 5112.2]SEB52474.1 Sugar kinase of the NBD/HSP70 family, may contain an N-terminal HTH domain [Streptomyces sp. 1222.5]